MMNLPPELQGALLDRRVVFVRGNLDESVVSATIGQLLLMSHGGPGQPIDVYLDSSGGSFGAALSIHDFLKTLTSPIAVTCLGSAGGAAVLILAAGSSGRRFALPHARINLHDEQAELGSVRAMSLADQAREAAEQRRRWIAALAGFTAHSEEHIARDLTSGRWLSAAEARDYGLVDGIIPGVSN
jgi:ATP-dependent Clp protease, protease subunit